MKTQILFIFIYVWVNGVLQPTKRKGRTGIEGPLKVRGSQASDSKEALCGRQPTILFTGSISSLIAFKQIQK